MTIETERLILRHFYVEDASAIHELFCDKEAMRFVGMYPAFTTIEETRKRIENWQGNDRRLAITLKVSETVVGYIAINPDSEEDREDTCELGFAIISKYRNKGYVKEAVNAVLSKLKIDGIKYVWACCFKENTASEELIRSMGFEFQQEGTYDAVNDKVYASLEFRMKL